MEKTSGAQQYDPVISSSAGLCYRSELTNTQKKGIEQCTDTEIARNFLVGLFFMTHQAEDSLRTDLNESFSFQCQACGEFTEYYRRPIPGYTPPLCLSIPCLTKRMKHQYEQQHAYDSSDEEDYNMSKQDAHPDQNEFLNQKKPKCNEETSNQSVRKEEEILIDDMSDEGEDETHSVEKKNK